MCGDRLPKRSGAAVARPTSGFSNVLFMASLGLTAFSFLSPHKLPLSVTLSVSGFLFALSVGERLLRKNSGLSGRSYQRLAARVRQ
jgi:hypothetical protein